MKTNNQGLKYVIPKVFLRVLGVLETYTSGYERS